MGLAACAPRDGVPEPPLPYSHGAEALDAAETESPADPGFLDPNLATAAALNALPGMSDSVTLALIAGRPYSGMLAVDKVLSRYLSAQWRDSVYAHLWIPFDLNTASSDEIMLIPGVDTRLRHELEEYRPYYGIEAFRRDIGEQVGPREVTRLERYVRIR